MRNIETPGYGGRGDCGEENTAPIKSAPCLAVSHYAGQTITIEQSTNLCEGSQYPENAPTKATRTLTIRYLSSIKTLANRAFKRVSRIQYRTLVCKDHK